ncbi:MULTISPECIES: tetratricopeptide repeat protein [unclassified Halomonas]|uniref:tetratricopeptide repeat protein n=1 Tax=unclassified Halomonas TaxID=2609666 RepID=UPI0005FA54FA|nr:MULTISPECIES: tetratricopeptide repeat protein [unclassified Halomonas]MCO7217679.1 tetratricopeptide repeat protein [Halomonas sp. OfavH-34-E]
MPPNARHGKLTCTLATLSLTAWLAGCQSFSYSPGSASQADPMAGAPPITRGLDADGLSTLLIAEMAGQRGDYRRATEGYLKAAERYHSAALVERATLASRFTDDTALIERAARRWQELAPEAPVAAQILGNLAGGRGNWDEALKQRLIAADDDTDITRFVDTALSSGGDPAALAGTLEQALDEPTLPESRQDDLRLALALTDSAQGDNEGAQRRIAALGNNSRDNPQRILAESRIALDAGKYHQARLAAKRGLNLSPGDPRFLLLMARADIRLGNLVSAESSTDTLLETRGDNPLLRVGLAQLYLEEGHHDPARRLLLPLVDDPQAPSALYLLLGSIAEQEDEVDNALLYYRRVPPGPDFLLSRQRAASMLIEADRLLDARAFLRVERLRHDDAYTGLVITEVQLLDQQGLEPEAEALLNRELARSPEDGDLRYFRAMRAWSEGDLDTSEQDLRTLVEQQPDNAVALNALGYTLADAGDPDDLDEARRLIQRAYELSPDNPAILDSLGWVAYREGKPEVALPWIERAWREIADQEVAAHLIEVLWDLGQKQRARELLQEAQQRFPERPLIVDLLDRRPEIRPEPTATAP